MQLDSATLGRYQHQAPELLAAVDTGEAEHIMRRDPQTDFCVKFENGLCGIHAKYGTDYLGDACHFYPRITRSLGEQRYMTAAMSCPEIVRLALFDDNAFDLKAGEIERLPVTIKDYLPAEMTTEQAMALHGLFVSAAGNEQLSPERIIMQLCSVSRSLQSLAIASWKDAAPFYLARTDMLLPAPEFAVADPFNLLHAFAGLIAASKKVARPRLQQVIHDMEKALHVTLDWQNVGIATSAESLPAWQKMEEEWRQKHAAALAPMLRRWIQAQLAMTCFPFAGFGNNALERIAIIGVRFATTKLALMSYATLHGELPSSEIVRILQSISRFLDHLADPTLSLAIYQETGWLRDARLRALVGDL